MDSNKIDCNVLTYYMNRIHSFLTSPKTSQIFPGLSKDVEDILVKIAGQNDLKLQGFDDDFKALVTVIKSEIERKKGEYQLSCEFQELSSGARSLIYRKTKMPITFEQPQPLRKPNSMTSNKQPSPASSDLITQSFKLRCLNATLKFVKDESRLSLRYPEMSTEQAQHVVNMFQHSDSDGDLGLGYKTLYAPLWEAIKIFGLKYQFTLRYTDPKDKNMKCLVLDKVPIVHTVKNKENLDQNIPKLCQTNSVILPDDSNQNTSKISLMDISDGYIISSTNNTPAKTNNIKSEIDKSTDTKPSKKPPNTTKLKPTPKLIDTIKLLGDDFMSRTYKKILDFIMDETAASLVFYNMSPEETQVLIHWREIMEKPKYKLLLSGNCMFILSQLSHNFKKKNFSIVVNEGKRNSKSDHNRNITFNKVPSFEDLPASKVSQESASKPLASQVGPITSSASQVSAKSSASQVSTKQSASQVSVKPSATQVSAAKPSANQLSAAKSSEGSAKPSVTQVTATKSSASQISTTKPSANQVAASSASQVSATKPSASQVSTKGISAPKMKLLEGLDQPVTSDKAMKMMLNMGWEGGALGTRGEGIVEPIRLSLDTGKRHGLGAPIEKPKPKTETPSKTNKYHIESLKTILDVLTSDTNSKEITFPEAHMKREWTYLKNMIIIFNKGTKNISVAKKGLEVVDEIVQIMNDSDWILTAGLKTDKITVVIKKSILPLFPNELVLYCEIVAFTESSIYRDRTFKDIYKGLHINRNRRHVEKINLGNNTKEVKESSSTELTKRSGAKDQNKDIKDETPVVPIGNGNKSTKEKDSKSLKQTGLTVDFKNNVLANILLFCQTDIEHKFIKFEQSLVEIQRDFIEECIEKVNTNTTFMEKNLENRFYEQIIAAMDDEYKIAVVFSSPCSINLEKEYPHYELTVKNINNNNVTLHYYDEDIESDGETKDTYLDPEQSFVNDDACEKLDDSKKDKCDNQNNNIHDKKCDTKLENYGVKRNDDIELENDVEGTNINVQLANNDVQVKNTDLQLANNNVHNKNADITPKIENNVQSKNINVQLENNYIQVKNTDDSDSDVGIKTIENEDLTITIASGDESDILKSDSEDDLSISKILSKLNDYKNTNINKSEKDDRNSGEVDRLVKDAKYSENDNHDPEKDNLKMTNMPIKVEKHLENTDISNGKASKESCPGKRSRCNSQNSLQEDPKKLKTFCKKIAIVPENVCVTPARSC